MRKPNIPAIPTNVGPGLSQVLAPMKECLETVMGRRRSGQRIAPLATTATDAEVIAKINEILDILQ